MVETIREFEHVLTWWDWMC